jgi:hypothetical protein
MIPVFATIEQNLVVRTLGITHATGLSALRTAIAEVIG